MKYEQATTEQRVGQTSPDGAPLAPNPTRQKYGLQRQHLPKPWYQAMKYGSVCSGVEAATLAWHGLGWQPQFFSEIEPFCCRLLQHRFPSVPNLGDLTKFKDWSDDIKLDLLVGGTPCQAFSVAGLRQGLADPRGNLALVFLGLLDKYRPRWVVWENVPGVLSSSGGRDFGAFLGALAELGYGFTYRVLDAQHFGVPQRRRRVFVVGYLGDWRRAAAVLFERESLCGNPPPRREAGKGTAPTLAARTKGGGGLGTDFDCDGGLISFQGQGTNLEFGSDVAGTLRGNADRASGAAPCVAATLTRGAESAGKGGYAGRRQEDDDNLVATVAQTLDASYGEKWGLDDQHINNGGSLFVAHALRADGFDASEDGTGRGTPLIPIDLRQASRGDKITNNREHGSGGAPGHGIGNDGDPAFTVSERGQAIAFDETQITSKENRSQPRAGDPSHPLAAGARPPTIAYTADDYESGSFAETELSGPMTTSADRTRAAPIISSLWRVRRLTPTECERLQGFPDGYTNVSYRGKPAADGPRYKALGNSMAVNVMRWIGTRIQMIEDLTKGLP